MKKEPSGIPNSRPIRIARIIDRLNVGGPAKHVVWLTSALNSEEYETTLITGTVPKGEGDMSYFATDAGVTPMVIKEMSRELGPRDAANVPLGGRSLSEFAVEGRYRFGNYGIVGFVDAGQVSSLWLRPRQCYVVHTFHGHVFHGYFGKVKTRLFIGIEKMLARLCTDRIVVISEQQRAEVCERYGVGRREQFVIIPLGIDQEEVCDKRGALRKEFGIAEDEIVIGAVGRICEVKNYSMLLQAAAWLWRNGIAPAKLRLVLVGDGHLRRELEMLADVLGISGRIIFTGFRDDAATLYADFDLVALTSLNEGTPLTLIEAMHQGCAVAATEVGGVVDLMGGRQSIANGFTIWEHGVTAPSRDVEAFARAMKFLIERPELRARMGARGREFVRTHFSKQRLVSDIKQLYCSLLGIPTVTSLVTKTVSSF